MRERRRRRGRVRIIGFERRHLRPYATTLRASVSKSIRAMSVITVCAWKRIYRRRTIKERGGDEIEAENRAEDGNVLDDAFEKKFSFIIP